MMQQACVRFVGTSPEDLDDICDDVRETVNKTGVNLSGPIPLPTKMLEVPARESSDGEGVTTWEHWETRAHERLIDLNADERVLRQLMHVQVLNDASTEIVLED